MGSEPSTSEGKIKVDESYPSEQDEPPPFDIKKIENIRSNVKFEQCYEIAKHIGDGKFGKVFQVTEKSTGREFAAKFIRIRKEADRQEVEREVSILTHLRHPRIAKIYDAFYTTTNDVVLIMEVVRGGELFDRVADENYVLTEQAVVMIICQLCEAIEYIHQQNILHLDIKPENIMCVSQTGNRIKLIDFGLARHYDGTQELKYMAGTPEFGAPEVIKYEKLDYHTDMWSVGVITYILLSGYSPFLGDNLGETYCNVERGVWEFTEEFDAVSDEAKDFISKLLVYDQRKRMLPAECLAHPWIARQRSKVQCDTALEKPGEGPKIDNKMMMRYNAKRKFRRMIIYVKFLIEMNRLRNSLRERMSEHGQKFFDPLLKMAEEKEKRVALICPPVKKSDIGSVVDKLKTPVSDKNETAVENGTINIFKKKAKEEVVKTDVKESVGAVVAKKSEIGQCVNDMVTKVNAEAPVKKRVSVPKLDEHGQPIKKKKIIKKEDGTEVTANDEVKTKKKKESITINEETKKEPSTLPPTPKKAELVVKKLAVSSDGILTKKPSIPSDTSLRTRPASPEGQIKRMSVSSEITKSNGRLSVAKVDIKALSDTERKEEPLMRRKSLRKVLSSEVSLNEENGKKTDPLLADAIRKQDSVVVELGGEKKKRKSVTSVTKKAVEAEKKTEVLNEAPKKTMLLPSKTPTADLFHERTTVPKEKKALKSESSESHKENQIEEKKTPTRQGALRSKGKSTENLISLASAQATTESSAVSTREPEKVNLDRVLVKRKTSTQSEGDKSKKEAADEAKSIGIRSGSLVAARLSKLSDSEGPLIFNTSSVPTIKKVELKAEEDKNVDNKRVKNILVTTEKKTTTTTATTTSVKRKTATSEKKVQHTSDGKSVEQLEKRSSQQDNVKVSQVTTKREESPELSTPLTSVKRNVVKQDSLKATTEKSRREEEKGKDDASSLVKMSQSVKDKKVDKITVEQKTKASNGMTKQLSLSGTNDVTRKVEGETEIEVSPRKISLKKADVIVSEKVRTNLEAAKDDKKAGLQKTCTTVIKITPDTTGDEHVSLKSSLGSKKSSLTLDVPRKALSRDNSEERKKVRFANDLLNASQGLQKVNSESCLAAKVETTQRTEIKKSKDDGELKKKKKKLILSKSEDVATYTPRDDYSFDNLKEKLLRRVSVTDTVSKQEPKKECVPVIKASSVKDRLRQFEKKN